MKLLTFERGGTTSYGAAVDGGVSDVGRRVQQQELERIGDATFDRNKAFAGRLDFQSNDRFTVTG